MEVEVVVYFIVSEKLLKSKNLSDDHIWSYGRADEFRYENSLPECSQILHFFIEPHKDQNDQKHTLKLCKH